MTTITNSAEINDLKPQVAAVNLAIGICTFRRPGLLLTLQSIAAQDVFSRMGGCVIVAENDDTPSASQIIDQARGFLPVDIHYVRAPARNISIARNALMDTAQGLGITHLAMIDDDEIAEPDWLHALLTRMEDPAIDVVLGQVIAMYRPQAPDWMRAAGLHNNAPKINQDGSITTGSTGNAMLRLTSPHIASRRFNLQLGQTGGEDDAFFHAMVSDGGTIAYAANAIVKETVPQDRETMAFLLRRNYRSGQTYAVLHSQQGAARLRYFATSVAKIATMGLSAGLFAMRPARRTKSLMRASFHIGVCAHLLGRGTLKLYGS